MTFDIGKLEQRRKFSVKTVSLGTIQCSHLTLGMLSNIEKVQKTEDLDGVTFARQLLRHVGHHITEREREESGDDKDENKNSTLSDEDMHRISDEEIETFSREFIAHNEWLLETYEDAQRSVTTNNDGERVIPIQPTPVDLPKKTSERDSDYLFRVVRRYLDEHTKRIRRMFRQFSAPLFRNVFSSATEDLLKRHVSLSDQLGKTLRGLDSGPTGPHPDTIAKLGHANLKLPDLPENPSHETNRRLRDVLGHAEDLRPIIFQSAELFRSMSNTALQMHADFNKSAKRSLFVSLVVVGIAAASLIVTAVYSWWSYERSSMQEVQIQHNFLEQQRQIEMLIKRHHEGYRQLLDLQDEQLERLVVRQDAQIERIIDSLQTTTAILPESNTK